MKLEYIIRKTVILFLSLFALTGLMAPEMINAAERNIPIYHNNIYYYDDEEDSTSNPDNLFIQIRLAQKTGNADKMVIIDKLMQSEPFNKYPDLKQILMEEE